MSPITLILLFVLFVIALIPAMRLWTAGFSLGARTAYLVTLLAFGLLTLEARPLARFLLPIGLLLYLLPFSGLPERWTRWRRRRVPGAGPPSGGEGPNRASFADRATAGRFGRRRTSNETIIEGRAVRLDDEAEKPLPDS